MASSIKGEATEIYTIDKVINSIPVTYKLKDYRGEVLDEGFYGHEILKATHTDVYLIEKEIKEQGNRVFVKWLGFDDSHNSWINKENMSD